MKARDEYLMSGLGIPNLPSDIDPSVAGASDAEIARIAALHARIRTHNEAVEANKAKVGDEPEFKEYLARWQAFVDLANKLGEKSHDLLWWNSAEDIKDAEQQFTSLTNELERVGLRIELRQRAKINEELAAAVKTAADKAAAAKEQGKTIPEPTPEQKAASAKLDESVRRSIAAANPHMEKTPATTVPPGPGSTPQPGDDKTKDEYFAAKIGGVAAIGFGTLAGALVAKSDVARVGVAVGGSLLTALAAWFSFSPSHEKCMADILAAKAKKAKT